MSRSRSRSRSRSKSRSRSRSRKLGVVTAYCVACRKKVKLMNAKVVVLKNGRSAVTGKCKECSHKVYKFIKA